MKNYVKPQFKYVSLLSEERFAIGSGANCTLYGTCPVDCDTAETPGGLSFPVNYYEP